MPYMDEVFTGATRQKNVDIIDKLITDLPNILNKGAGPHALVAWIQQYAQAAESVNYGSNEQKAALTGVFQDHDIVAGQHEALQKHNHLIGEGASVCAHFIAGQLLHFNLNPRYFNSVANAFHRMHGSQPPAEPPVFSQP